MLFFYEMIDRLATADATPAGQVDSGNDSTNDQVKVVREKSGTKRRRDEDIVPPLLEGLFLEFKTFVNFKGILTSVDWRKKCNSRPEHINYAPAKQFKDQTGKAAMWQELMDSATLNDLWERISHRSYYGSMDPEELLNGKKRGGGRGGVGGGGRSGGGSATAATTGGETREGDGGSKIKGTLQSGRKRGGGGCERAVDSSESEAIAAEMENSEGESEGEDIFAQGDTARNVGSGTKKRRVSRGGGTAGKADGADGKGKEENGSKEETKGKGINKAAPVDDSDDEPLFKKDPVPATTRYVVNDDSDDNLAAASVPVQSSDGEEEEDDEEEDDDGEDEGIGGDGEAEEGGGGGGTLTQGPVVINLVTPDVTPSSSLDYER